MFGTSWPAADCGRVIPFLTSRLCVFSFGAGAVDPDEPPAKPPSWPSAITTPLPPCLPSGVGLPLGNAGRSSNICGAVSGLSGTLFDREAGSDCPGAVPGGDAQHLLLGRCACPAFGWLYLAVALGLVGSPVGLAHAPAAACLCLASGSRLEPTVGRRESLPACEWSICPALTRPPPATKAGEGAPTFAAKSASPCPGPRCGAPPKPGPPDIPSRGPQAAPTPSVGAAGPA